MSWSGGTFTRTNGTYTGASVWQSDAGAAIGISADRHDLHDKDLADGINQCVNKDGSNASGIVTESWLADDAASRSTLLFECRNTQTGTNGSSVTSRSGAGTGYVQGLPKACKVTHMTLTRLEQGVSVSAGSITAVLYKNNSSTSQSVTMSSGDPMVKVSAMTAQSYAAGDNLHIQTATNSLTYSGAGLDGVTIQVWGHFIE